MKMPLWLTDAIDLHLYGFDWRKTSVLNSHTGERDEVLGFKAETRVSLAGVVTTKRYVLKNRGEVGERYFNINYQFD